MAFNDNVIRGFAVLMAARQDILGDLKVEIEADVILNAAEKIAMINVLTHNYNLAADGRDDIEGQIREALTALYTLPWDEMGQSVAVLGDNSAIREHMYDICVTYLIARLTVVRNAMTTLLADPTTNFYPPGFGT